jgi:hypothetical protein
MWFISLKMFIISFKEVSTVIALRQFVLRVLGVKKIRVRVRGRVRVGA